MLISLSDNFNIDYSLNYVMYEFSGVVLYSTLYTIGTYGCEFFQARGSTVID